MGKIGDFFVYAKNNKIFVFLMLLIIVSGIFIRFSDYAMEGYDVDSQNILAGATYWFYPPYKQFPGMIDQQPPLGDMIIGLGCMASGEDFSGVREVTPLYFPNRAKLIGQACVNAEKYCFFPVYLFGAIFLLVIAIIALLMLDKTAAVFFTAFFAYSPLIIKWNRLIHIDSILWVFVGIGLVFLWSGYIAQQDSKKERIYFILAFSFLGLAGATKFTAGLYFIFAPLIFAEKYKREVKIYIGKLARVLSLTLWRDLVNEKINIKALKTFILSISAMILCFLAPFKFNPKNFFAVYNAFTTMNRPGSGQIQLTWNFFKGMYYFIVNMNFFETIILAFSISILIIMLIKRNKDKLEKFIIYLLILQFITMTLFEEVVLGIGGVFRAVPFMFGFVLLMALAFSKRKNYSLVRLLNIRTKHVYAILFIFVCFAAITVYVAPAFQRPNSLVCLFNKETCETFQGMPGQAKASAAYLKDSLNEGEYFLYGDVDPTVYFYLQPEVAEDTWAMISHSTQTVGRRPYLNEYASYFEQIGKPLRYILLSSIVSTEEREEFKKQYLPNHIVKYEGIDVAYVYDIKDLQPRP